MKKVLGLILGVGMAPGVWAEDTSFEQTLATIHRQAGCYIVDYRFHEEESLQEGYKTDERVYDANADKTIYEWIVPIRKSATELRLQHVLFMRDLERGQVAGMMKHHAEDWSFEQDSHYEFVEPGVWTRKMSQGPGLWTRKITNLDDGLRYQCEGAWNLERDNPEWNCANFAPIPGRETRDMGRKDYNTLDRDTRLIIYPSSWIERQNNIKTIYTPATENQAAKKEPLARELGHTWYVRQPDSACDDARAFGSQQSPYWKVLMDSWEEVYATPGDFVEASAGKPPRFVAMMELEEHYAPLLRMKPGLIPELKQKILEVIESYRAH